MSQELLGHFYKDFKLSTLLLSLIDSQKRLFEHCMTYIHVSFASADALAPLGARASAGAMMNDFKPFMYTAPALWGLTIWKQQSNLHTFLWRKSMNFERISMKINPWFLSNNNLDEVHLKAWYQISHYLEKMASQFIKVSHGVKS